MGVRNAKTWRSKLGSSLEEGGGCSPCWVAGCVSVGAAPAPLPLIYALVWDMSLLAVDVVRRVSPAS